MPRGRRRQRPVDNSMPLVDSGKYTAQDADVKECRYRKADGIQGVAEHSDTPEGRAVCPLCSERPGYERVFDI